MASTNLVSAVVVHKGSIADREGIRRLLEKTAAKLPGMKRVCDAGDCHSKIESE